jgi:hypothetical protein
VFSLITSPATHSHFGTTRRSNGGDDIVVLTGTAEILDDYPVPDNPAWLEKYGEAIDARFGSAVKFSERFSAPARIHLTHVRGF